MLGYGGDGGGGGGGGVNDEYVCVCLGWGGGGGALESVQEPWLRGPSLDESVKSGVVWGF